MEVATSSDLQQQFKRYRQCFLVAVINVRPILSYGTGYAWRPVATCRSPPCLAPPSSNIVLISSVLTLEPLIITLVCSTLIFLLMK